MSNAESKCECGADLSHVPPPFPPQMNNGPMISAVTMINGRAECPSCGAKYITQIAGAQINLGLVRIEEPKRIVVPHMVPPNLTRVK